MSTKTKCNTLSVLHRLPYPRCFSQQHSSSFGPPVHCTAVQVGPTLEGWLIRDQRVKRWEMQIPQSSGESWREDWENRWQIRNLSCKGISIIVKTFLLENSIVQFQSNAEWNFELVRLCPVNYLIKVVKLNCCFQINLILLGLYVHPSCRYCW